MFLDPHKSIYQLGLRDGMRVADFGTGSGFYVKSLSAIVGNTGKVYAVEVQKGLVKKLESDLKQLKLSNVDCIWGDIEVLGGTKIAEGSMDAVIISNVLFQAEDKLGLIDEAKRILKKNGKVLLIDWKESFGGMGPAPEHVMTKEKAQELFLMRGFKFLENITTGDHQYGIIFMYE